MASPENDFDFDQEESQNINDYWTSSSPSGDTTSSTPVDNSTPPMPKMSVPKLSDEEQAIIEAKRNSPEFQKEFQDLLPKEQVETNPQKDYSKDLSAFVKKLLDSSSGTDSKNKKNNTGLPDDLKAKMEAMSGFSLDKVKVYYNSKLPEKYGALAYTEGMNIYLAPGQEEHLEHELWHVIQQLKGDVKATTEVNGKKVDDRQAIEVDADNKAKEVQQQKVGSESDLETTLVEPDIAQRQVIQRIASQLQLDNKGNIAGVSVRGRPKNTFSDSMGDHTSAFITQLEGINIALEGKTIAQAIDYVDTLRKELKSLPGYKFMQISEADSSYTSDDSTVTKTTAKTDIGARFLEEYNRLESAIAGGKSDNQDVNIQCLQQAISAYLSARELIPFSTINVRAKSALGGNGHGESGHAATLSTYERMSSDSTISDEALIEAINGLFDMQSAGMLVTEQNKQLALIMTGGIALDPKQNLNQKFELIWQQHLKSIELMYPNVYDKVKDLKSLGSEDWSKDLAALLNRDFFYEEKSIFARIEELKRSILDLGKTKLALKNMEKLKLIYQGETYLLSALDKLKSISSLSPSAEQQDAFQKRIGMVESQISTYAKSIPQQLQYDEATDKDAVDKLIAKYKAAFIKDNSNSNTKANLSKLKAFQGGSPILKANLISDEEVEDIEEEEVEDIEEEEVEDIEEEEVEDIEEEEVEEVDDSSGKRKQRSSSEDEDAEDEDEDEEKPLKRRKKLGTEPPTKLPTKESTMSSMAIQVLLDRSGNITKMLSSGRPPSPFKNGMGAHTTAWTVHLDRIRKAIIGKKVPEAIVATQKITADVNKFATERGKPTGDNAKIIYAPSLAEMNKANKVGKTGGLIALQNLINATLSFYNLIPGVSKDKIDTTGNGEGTHRKVVLLYEHYGHGTKEAVSQAVKGLFDGGTSGTMHEKHKTIIEETYPDAYDLVYEDGEPKKKLDLPKENDFDEEDDYVAEKLSADQVKAMTTFSKQKGDAWLVHTNNCLINAITDAAGLARATADQVIDIRGTIGSPLGEMLWASQRVLDIILQRLDAFHGGNLHGQGVLTIYANSGYMDSSSNNNNPLLIHHDGINHFTALDDNPKAKQKKKEEVEEDVMQD